MTINDSARLSFRLMTAADAELLFQLDQDPEVMRYINGGKVTTMDDIIKVFIPRMQSYTNREKGWGLWQVTVKDTAQFIGWILVRPMEYFSDNPQWHNIELGWRFMQSEWGKGYGTEAADTIKNAIASRSDVTQITAIAIEGNDASIKIMQKLGMQYVKTDIHQDPLGDAEVVFYQLDVG